MFWIKTIENLEEWKKRLMNDIMSVRHKYTEQDVEIIELKNKIDALMESNESYLKEFVDIKKDIEAITAVLASDRKDINALIQLIKKSTKGKK